MHGHKYNWNAHPLAPPGTKAIVYESPQCRASWGPRGLDAWAEHIKSLKRKFMLAKYGVTEAGEDVAVDDE